MKNFIIKEGFGGGMVWSLALDDFMMMCGSREFPLMNTMKDLFEAEDNGGVAPTLAPTAAPTAAPVTTKAPTNQPTNNPVTTRAPTKAPVTTSSPGGSGKCHGLCCVLLVSFVFVNVNFRQITKCLNISSRVFNLDFMSV